MIMIQKNIYLGTKDCQFNVSCERHPAGILLVKVHGKCLVLHLVMDTRTSSTAGKYLNHKTTQLWLCESEHRTNVHTPFKPQTIIRIRLKKKKKGTQCLDNTVI